MSTDIVSPAVRVGMLRHELANALAAKAQAEDAQHLAEEVARVAEERATAEADRADGAEAHIIGILAECIVDPIGELPGGVAASIAESIRQDLNGGLAYEDVNTQAAVLRDGWWEDQR
jgi:hypothetical protein